MYMDSSLGACTAYLTGPNKSDATGFDLRIDPWNC
jgi:hypothetical protein